jgi:hypothetical protein
MKLAGSLGALVKIAAILITISLCIGLVLAGEKRDGDWWCAQSETVKVAYVLGALDHAAGHAAVASVQPASTNNIEH